MRIQTSTFRAAFAAVALLIALTGLLQAAQEKPDGRRVESGSGDRVGTVADDKPRGQNNAALDKQIFGALKDIINTGADLYNKDGDAPGCYRLYQGALIALRPLLGHHPDLQSSIDAALAESERMTSVRKRAHALNSLLFDIRDKLKPPVAGKTPGQKEKAPLWDRLGGEARVRRVVNDFVNMAVKDAKVDFTRGGKYKLDDAALAELKDNLVGFISAHTGGPSRSNPALAYVGKDMKEAHKDMHITNEQFDAIAADLKKALEQNGVQPTETDELLKIVGTTRKDIVETKKPEEKKPEDKKP